MLEESPTAPDGSVEAPRGLTGVGDPGSGLTVVTLAMNEAGDLAGRVEFSGNVFRVQGSALDVTEGTFGGLTDDGTVVFSRQLPLVHRVFRWLPDGIEEPVPFPWSCSAEVRVNAVGERGRSVTPNGVIFATVEGIVADEGCLSLPSSAGDKKLARWTSSEGWQNLGLMGEAQLDAVSDDGEVAVLSRSAPGGTEILRWTVATGVQSLGVLPGGGRATDVNNAGVVVGGNGNNTTVWRWNTTDGFVSIASGLHPFINNLGDIAYVLGLPGHVATLSSGTTDTIKTAWLPGGPLMNVSYVSQLAGFNDRGEVFGTFSVANPEPIQYPFFYANGHAHLLDPFGSTLGRTVAATSAGVVGGTVWNHSVGLPTRWSPPPAPTAPARPTNLVAQAAADTAIDVTWSDASGNEADFHLERRTRNPDGTFTRYETVLRPAANSTSHADEGLVSGTPYQYRLRACNTIGCSLYAQSAILVVGTPPAAPADLTRAVVSGPAVQLTWTDLSGNESEFLLTRRLRSPEGVWGAFGEVARPAANSVTHDDGGVAPGGVYQYRLAACNAAGCSAVITSTTVTMPTLPLAPTDAAALQTSATAARLTWTDASTNELEFVVGRRTSDGMGGWGAEIEVGRLVANKKAFNDSGLAVGQTYQYVVTACNLAGCSVAATAVVAMAPSPTAPQAVITAGVTAGQLRASWTDASTNETKFQVYRRQNVGGSWQGYTLVAQPSAGTVTYLDGGLVSGGTYQYRVRSCFVGGCSGYATGLATTAP